MSRLAAEHSISDVGLKKICTRHGIPTPPRGYWAKLEAGKAPARPELPPSTDATPIELPVAAPLADDGVLAGAVAEARAPENRIIVSERLHSPCDVVREAREALQAAQHDPVGILKRPPKCLELRVSRGQLSRALRIADALLKCFKERGWDVVVRQDATVVFVEGVEIELEIEEATEAVELPAKRDLGSGYYSFHHSRRGQVERRPSGKLSISIRERSRPWNHELKRNFRESEKRSFEERLSDVVVGILQLASLVKEDLERRQQKARVEQDRQRTIEAALEEQRRLHEEFEEEKTKVAHLLEQVARWRTSHDLRAFIDEVRERGSNPELKLEGDALSDWIDWADRQADRLDPFAPTPPSILDEDERIERMMDEVRGRR